MANPAERCPRLRLPRRHLCTWFKGGMLATTPPQPPGRTMERPRFLAAAFLRLPEAGVPKPGAQHGV